ncbi:hypothetical protein [Ancylobacter mangrovi]|uniref:hypothetical protein n=1 Tax=Ancylobacter mangrovi TaxID=2972472 RepID=UPI00216244CA|nr:hypothetical protein [Ancylobacter mangrovi]MCS0501619.1 hypothetical protein [Ancylobacter mangrovi]
MARVSTRVEPIDRNIVLAIRKGEDPAQRGARLAAFARQALAEAQEINRQATGAVPPHETFVDGRQGAPLESVKPDGVIVFEFDLLGDLFEWVGEMLVKHSPVRTGRYSDSHLFFADGVQVDPGAALPSAEEYVFINVQPYARKIERGLSPQAPEGVYEAVAAMARARFGNLAHIRFSYRSFQEGGIVAYIPAGAPATRDRRGRFASGAGVSEARNREHATRRPAVVIQMR